MSAAVADAGPLIHLCEAEALPLLRVFAAIHIPESVWMSLFVTSAIIEQAISGLPRID